MREASVYARIRASRPSIFHKPEEFRRFSGLLDYTSQGEAGRERFISGCQSLYRAFKRRYKPTFPLDPIETKLIIENFAKKASGEFNEPHPFIAIVVTSRLEEDYLRLGNLVSLPPQTPIATPMLVLDNDKNGDPPDNNLLYGLVRKFYRLMNSIDDFNTTLRDKIRLSSLEDIAEMIWQVYRNNPECSLRAPWRSYRLETPGKYEENFLLRERSKLLYSYPPHVFSSDIYGQMPKRIFFKGDAKLYVKFKSGSFEALNMNLHPLLPIRSQPSFVAIGMDLFGADHLLKADAIRSRGIDVMEPVGRVISLDREFGIFRWVKGTPLYHVIDPHFWEKFGSLLREVHQRGIALNDAAGRNVIVRPDETLALIDLEHTWLTAGRPLNKPERMVGLERVRRELSDQNEKLAAFEKGYKGK